VSFRSLVWTLTTGRQVTSKVSEAARSSRPEAGRLRVRTCVSLPELPQSPVAPGAPAGAVPAYSTLLESPTRPGTASPCDAGVEAVAVRGTVSSSSEVLAATAVAR
jgi:hypothetical protein